MAIDMTHWCEFHDRLEAAEGELHDWVMNRTTTEEQREVLGKVFASIVSVYDQLYELVPQELAGEVFCDDQGIVREVVSDNERSG